MSQSISKLNSAKRRKQAETTLSAHLLTKSKCIQQKSTRPKITPFQLEPHLQSLSILQSKQLKTVKDINFQYIELFQALFQKSIATMEIVDKGKLNRQQRYQLECMKILTKTNQNVEKLNQIKNVQDSWALIRQYMDKKDQKEIINLINRYKEVSKSLDQAEQQHQQLLDRTVSNFERIQEKQDSALFQLQRQYKRNSRRLNKLLSEQQYYTLKCQFEQQKLEELQGRIKKLEDSKLNLDMKIIGQGNKRDRMLRKNKEKQRREKSAVPLPNDHDKQQKIIRSKSSVRYHTKQV